MQGFFICLKENRREFDVEEENIEAQIKVAYRKEYLNIEDFKEVAWLNKFVSNLNELRAMNK